MSKKTRSYFWSGNEAMVKGAMDAGCRFFAGYPITPSSEIVEEMSRLLPQVDGTFIQMEDEIASIGAVAGASLAGIKAMTATSGPGFSLMQENIGYACMAEIPCVIVNVMRQGPSTGMPTRPSQGDVMQAKWGTHGDHPIVVLAVSSAEESYEMTVTAFNLSEKLRTPVIVLSDESVAHTREKVWLAVDPPEIVNRRPPTVPPDWFVPYKNDSSMVPEMGSFGQGYRYHVTGLVHDERGFPTERSDEVQAFFARLFGKLERYREELMLWRSYQLEDADIVLIAYGSPARAARHAVQVLREMGKAAGVLQLITLFPFLDQVIREMTEGRKLVAVPEMNLGHMKAEIERHIQSSTRILGINRVDGALITPRQIVEAVLEAEANSR
jgi:2-oxoglutarate/2-oxoacid ferredoxin oxidoreductase subunit alpha